MSIINKMNNNKRNKIFKSKISSIKTKNKRTKK